MLLQLSKRGPASLLDTHTHIHTHTHTHTHARTHARTHTHTASLLDHAGCVVACPPESHNERPEFPEELRL